MKAWLTAGIPLVKLDHMRPFLAHMGVDMVDSSELREHIGSIPKEEHLKLAAELGGRHYSIAFDGSRVFDQVRDNVLYVRMYKALRSAGGIRRTLRLIRKKK